MKLLHWSRQEMLMAWIKVVHEKYWKVAMVEIYFWDKVYQTYQRIRYCLKWEKIDAPLDLAVAIALSFVGED